MEALKGTFSIDPSSRSQRNRSKIESSEYRLISMKRTRYITTTIQAGNRLEIGLPKLMLPKRGEIWLFNGEIVTLSSL